MSSGPFLEHWKVSKYIMTSASHSIKINSRWTAWPTKKYSRRDRMRYLMNTQSKSLEWWYSDCARSTIRQTADWQFINNIKICKFDSSGKPKVFLSVWTHLSSRLSRVLFYIFCKYIFQLLVLIVFHWLHD